MYRVTQQGEQLRRVQLTNYRASIKATILLDDGADVRREFEVEAELLGRHFTFTVPASEFASMDWPIAQMGPTAIIFPSQREYARTAIQSFSMTADERRIYTHTGWRRVGDKWVYLHVGGAVGEVGAMPGIEVRLAGALGRFELRLPSPDEVIRAFKASLHLARLGPASICFPLLAATCRAVFGDADFALHLAGETGAFKSELAALYQRHFGAAMDRLHLPGAWSSTANALETVAFQAKDILLVVDDFAPQGSAADVQRYHAAADRLFRAAGNGAGRARLDSAARLREPKPPRSLILSTGEDIPKGHSVRARLLVLELAKGAIVSGALTACQFHAESGLYTKAMGAFIQWLAARYEEMRATFASRVSELRRAAVCSVAHARTPDISRQSASRLRVVSGIRNGMWSFGRRGTGCLGRRMLGSPQPIGGSPSEAPSGERTHGDVPGAAALNSFIWSGAPGRAQWRRSGIRTNVWMAWGHFWKHSAR
jgi:hypothetical protein